MQDSGLQRCLVAVLVKVELGGAIDVNFVGHSGLLLRMRL